MNIKQLLVAVAGSLLLSVAGAQAVDATKHAAKATAEGAKEAGDNAKASMEGQPDRAIDKTKAKGHKASARAHRHRAKADAKAITQ